MIVDTGTLTTVLDQYLSIFQLGRQDMSSHAWGLLTALVTLEILLTSFAWLLSGSDALVGIIKKLLAIGFFVFVIQNYDSLMRVVIDGFIQTGKLASSASGDPLSSVRDPSSIVSAGFVATLPILDHLSSYGTVDVLYNLIDIIITGFCAIGIALSYFIIAIQVFVTYLEFGMVSTLGLMIIPFGVFKHTSFLAEKLFGAIISFGVKLMVLGFLVSVMMPLLREVTIPPDPSWAQLFNALVLCIANAALAWHAPGVAAGLLAGGPSLTASTAGNAAVAGAMGFESGALLSEMAARSPGKAVQTSSQVASAAAVVPGILTGGFQVASANAALQGKGAVSSTLKSVGGAANALWKSSLKVGTSPVTKISQGFQSGFETGRNQVPGASSFRKDNYSNSQEKTHKGSQGESEKTSNSEKHSDSSSKSSSSSKSNEPSFKNNGAQV